MNTVRLLVVDDDDVDRDKMRRLLARSEYPFDIVEAKSGHEAIERLRSMNFDCVLLDYRLGDVLGTDLVSDIEASSRNACPVIMVTGQSSERGAVEALRMGVYDYLPKRELRREQLLGAIEGSLRWAELQDRLRESEHHFQQLSESLPQLVWSCEPDGRCDYLSRQWLQYTGLPEADQLGQGWLAQLHPEDRDRVAAAWADTVARESDFDIEFRIRGADGRYRWFKTRAAPLRNATGQIVKWFGTNTDVHEAIELRAALEESEAKYRTLMQSMNDGAFVVREQRVVYTNPALPALLGYGEAEFLGLSISNVLVPKQDDPIAIDPDRGRQELQFIRKDGSPLWMELRMTPVSYAGQPGALGIVRDISDRKNAEAAMARALKEKTVLLNEVHHRVKNNLQIISGLLHLQASKTGNPDLSRLLEESQLRIRAMGLIHQLLYESHDFSQVDLSYYLHGLIDLLRQTYVEEQVRVEVVTDLDAVHLGLDLAVPCGLMINELLSNAFKHAFPERRSGKIELRLCEQDGMVRLMVSDSGVGLPAGFSIDSMQSLGLTLVQLLVDQIDGRITVTCHSGTSYEVIFPVTH